MKTLTVPDTTMDVLFRLLDAEPVQLLKGDEVQGFLLSPIEYEALIELLEDIEDLRDAALAEAEYQAGEGRPFSEYDAERRARSSVRS